MRVKGLLEIGMQVPSIDEARSFYEDFGLESRDDAATIALRCAGRDQDQLVLAEGAEKKLGHVAFAVEPGTLPAWQRHLESRRITVHDGPAGFSGEGLWVSDPDGGLVNIREREIAQARSNERFHNFPDSIQRVDKALWQSIDGLRVQPLRFGHTLFFSSDVARSESFYVDAFGLGVSDRIPGVVTFLNAGPGDHHIFGFIQSSHRGLHHASFEVPALDDLVLGAQTMAELGHRVGWGLGRHNIGSNLFHYIQDPWGSWIEYFNDIDQIGPDWEAKDWNPPSSAIWCPLMPGDFLQNQESKG